LRKSHIVNYAISNIRHSPGGGTTFQTTFSPVSFGKSFIKILSAVPENGCLIVLVDGKKQKNKKNEKKTKTKQKTSAKHIRIRLLPEGGCVNQLIIRRAKSSSRQQQLKSAKLSTSKRYKR